MQSPIVSVVMPVYNSAPFVGKAVQSVLQQRDVALELVVVDDGSTDDTLESVARAAGGDLRVRTLSVRHTGMPGVVRNIGAREARGDLLAFLDADDRYLEGRLSESVRILQSWPELAAVFSDHLRTYDQDAGGLGEAHLAGSRFLSRARHVLVGKGPGLYWTAPEFYAFMCLSGIPMHTDTVTLRRQVFLELGGFSETLRINQDEDLWFRLALRECLAYLDKPLACYCRRSGSHANDDNPIPVLLRVEPNARVNIRLHEQNYARGADRLSPSERRNYRRLIATRWSNLAYDYSLTGGSRVQELAALAHAWDWHPSLELAVPTLRALAPRRLRAWYRTKARQVAQP
jgi:glycosyltransferase involved in cell wall biosynthesis